MIFKKDLMKTILRILFFINILIFSNHIYSQRFNGGIHAGVSATQVSGDEQAGFNKAGIYGGGFVNIYFTQKSSVQLELNFIQKGSRKNPKPDNGDYTKYVCRLNYIEMPLMYKLDVAKWLTFEIGVSAAYLVKSSEEDENGPVSPYLQFKKYEISLIGGGYYNFSKHFMVNVRYENTLPFLPIRQHASRASHLLNKGQYNSVLVFALQYQFK